MRIRFIVNPNAGCRRGSGEVASAIETTFSRTHHRYDVRLTCGRGHATMLAEDAVRQGYHTVVAAGGDGTVNEVGTALVGSQVALGIIPRGSGNGLARELGIPLSTPRACQTILNGIGREIDVGLADGRYFFMAVGVGFDALVAMRFNQGPDPRRGMFPYFCIATKEALVFEPEPIIIRIDGEELTLKPFMVTVANSKQLGGSAVIAPHARIDDGFFDVCIVRNLTTLQFLWQAPKLFNGQIERVPQLDIRRADHLEIERENRSLMQVDGDPVEADSKLSISLLPGALKVWVPVTKSPRN